MLLITVNLTQVSWVSFLVNKKLPSFDNAHLKVLAMSPYIMVQQMVATATLASKVLI